VLAGHVVNQLLDQHRLAETGAAEESDLSALDERCKQVDDLETGFEDLDLRREVGELRRVAVDRPALGVGGRGGFLVDGLADDVPDAAESDVPDGNRDRLPRVVDLEPARKTVGRVHRHSTDAVVAEMLLHLCDQRACLLVSERRNLDPQRGVDLGETLGEHGVDHDALDLDDLAGLLDALFGHVSPGELKGRRGSQRASGPGSLPGLAQR
jgi:hypothetical protein